jgi:PST family polysaccharide transporter
VRVLGVEKFGLIMFAQAFIMYFNVLVDYGFNLSATREISIHRENKEKITEIYSSVMIIKFILILVSFLLLSIVVFSFERFSSDWILYYFTFLIVIGQALFPVWYFQGIENMKYITIINVSSKLFFTALIFIFIQEEGDYIYVPLINGLGFLITGVSSLYIVNKKFNQLLNFKNLRIKYYLKEGFYVFLSISSSTVLSASPILFIGLFINFSVAGYYAAFQRIITAVKNLFLIINQTFFPRLSKMYNENIIKYNKIWKKLTLYSLISSILFYFLILLFSERVISLYLGAEFLEKIYILDILAITVVFYVIINSLGLNGLLVMGKHKELAYSQIIPAILFFLLSPLVLMQFDLKIYIYLVLLVDLLIILIRVYYMKGFYSYGKS